MDNRFSIRSQQAADFFSPESFLIKLNGLTSPFHYQMRSNRVMAFRNWLNLMGHFLSFFKWIALPADALSSFSKPIDLCRIRSSDERIATFRTLYGNFLAKVL